MSAQLALATLPVHDTESVKKFYIDLLGLELVTAFSDPAGSFLFLHSKAGKVNVALQRSEEEKEGASGGAILGFAVEDADVVYREWQEKGIELVGEVIDVGAGRSFIAKDPEGNRVQVYHLYPQVKEIQESMGLI